MNEIYISKLNKESKIILKVLLNMGARREDAEDIIQETIYKYFIYIDSIDENKVKSWLFKVSINSYYDLVRKQKREEKLLLNFELHDLINEETPENILVNNSQLELVNNTLNRLNPSYKKLLILKYSVGLKYQEIANVLSTSQEIVKTNLYRARRKFIKEYRRIKNEER